jgi:alanine dehydrogenase
MIGHETKLISRSQVANLLTADECIAAIEGVFNLYGQGKAPTPGILGIHTLQGGFHIKAGTLNLGRDYFVAKTNANFPNNPIQNSLPTIQGVISVFDGENGRLLALMDSIEITILRTGAATAVAAKYLARPDSKTVTICGCGNQGRISLRLLAKLFALEKVFVYDIIEQTAVSFAKEMSHELNLDVSSVAYLSMAVRQSDICITCTPSKKPIIKYPDVSPGTFIAAVGADSDDKQELEPELLASSKVVSDITQQCATIGELHHAINKGLLSKENVHAELGEVVAKKKTARETDDEIIIFDSTGMALQDVASAVIVYEKAIEKGIGLSLNFSN